MSKWGSATIVIVAGIAAYALGGLAMWSSGIDQRDEEVIADARAQVEASKPFHRTIERMLASRDSALRAARVAEQMAAAEEPVIERLSGDSLIIGLRIQFPSLDSLLRSHERTAQGYRRALFFMNHVAIADSLVIMAQAERITELTRSLAAVVEIADCHIFDVQWLPSCPSRTTSAIIGAVTGVVAVLVAN